MRPIKRCSASDPRPAPPSPIIAPGRGAFTLVEVLVVIAIIGLLAALLLPALSAVLETTRRLQCLSNMKQLGVSLHSFNATEGNWPAGAMSRPYDPAPSHPHQFYRWSALALLTPYLEQREIFLSLNFDVPLYMPDFSVSAENTTSVRQSISFFLCPSDRRGPVENNFGAVSYVTCTGSGIDGGTPFETDGVFFVNSQTRSKDIRDGTANTVVMSESILGDGPNRLFDIRLAEPKTVYRYANVAPLTEKACEPTPPLFNFTERRGFSWANGEYRCTLYNHYLPPNSTKFDCVSARLLGDITVRFAAYGWRAARSRHPGGVNVLMADGSGHFVDEGIDLGIWRAISTREGGETSRLP